MTRERDFERLLDHWFADGPMEAPDRVIDSVADRIGRQPQRPVWRLLWRDRPVNSTLRMVAAAAAVILAVAVGFAVIGRPGSSGGIVPTPTPTVMPSAVEPSASPTGSPSAVSCVRGPCLGPLEAGSYTATEPLQPFGYTVPEGWENIFNAPGGYVLQWQDAPSVYTNGIYVFIDLQAADQACIKRAAPGVGQAVDDLIAWLTELPTVSATPPSPVTLGGLDGVTLDLTEAVASMPCAGERKLWVQEWSDDPNFWWGVVPGFKERLFVLDRGSGGTVFIILDAPSEDFAGFVTEAMVVVETFDFTP